jgi:ActR/RegA family two-component response regulator
VLKLGATAMIIKPATIDALETALKQAKMIA